MNNNKLKGKKITNFVLSVIFAILLFAFATFSLLVILVHNGVVKNDGFKEYTNKIWIKDIIWQILMPTLYALTFLTITLGIVRSTKFKLVETANQNLKSKRTSLTAFIVVFMVLFAIFGLLLFLTKAVKTQAVKNILVNLKINGFENWLLVSGLVLLALSGALLLILIFTLATLKNKSTSANKIKIKINKDNNSDYSTATLDFSSLKTKGNTNNDFFPRDLKSLNLKLVEDSDTNISTNGTPPSNIAFQSMQLLVNEINDFVPKLPLPRYAMLVEYVKRALEEYTIKPNENLTNEILVRKENNLAVNYKRARLVKLLLESKEYGMQVASVSNMQIMGSQLLNFVNSKYEIINNLTSLNEVKATINETLERYLFVKLNELRLEAVAIMQKNSSNVEICNAIKQVLSETDQALTKKDVVVMQSAVVRLGKLIQKIKDLKIVNV